ncbi:aminoglycoside 6'-N-acetyltransferase [Pedococcus cremeus]|uniref:Aminoglycoside 6'-N-acetyltransferase n=1 Tax=Pedococcus cremeus TaxID=587636 RepID=A0A1H9UUS5_9MICO|nr:GNAT family protein [Pedococcus cremeus]SES12807.1 aminoglycoside 6'-N-acetyltransferase [Pedococcus cremeus]
MPHVRVPITTDRLVLRSFRPGDEADVFAYRSVPEVVRFIPGDPRTTDEVADLVAERASAGRLDVDRPALTLAVELGGRVVGDVLIHLAGPNGVDLRQVEIGWVFAPDVAGNGYATEAARALVRVSFEELGVHRVWARVEPRNEPSVRLCERLGMRREGVLKQASWFKGEWTDLAFYALLADEYRPAQQP